MPIKGQLLPAKRKTTNVFPMRTSFLPSLFLLSLALTGCTRQHHAVPVVGFVQMIEDNTIDEARTGFFDALREAGFSDSAGTIHTIYRNAQGDIPSLNQIVDYFVSQHVALIGANTNSPNEASLTTDLDPGTWT